MGENSRSDRVCVGAITGAHGVRGLVKIKPFTEDLKERGLRTLDIFVSTVAAETGGKLPDNFVVMLPKVTIPEQITALVRFYELFEEAFEIDIPDEDTEKIRTVQDAIDYIQKNAAS